MAQASRRGSVLLLAVMLAGCASHRHASDQPGIRVGEEALRGGSPQIALQVAQSVLTRNPEDVRALLLRGDAQTQLGLSADADSAFVQALKLEPKSVHAMIGLGRVRLATDPAGAAALFENVVKQEPRNANALNNLGIARDLLGEHQEAQVAYRQVQSINPDMSAARVNLALSMAMSGDATNAIPLIAPLADEPSATAQVRHDYAAVLAMAGRDADAERILSHDLSPADVNLVMQTFHEQRAGAAAVAEPAQQAPVSLRARPPASRTVPPMRTNAVKPPASPVSLRANGHHFVAQLGVSVSEPAAKALWRHLREKLPATLAGHHPRTERISQNGASRWRLVADGFSSSSAVVHFCRTLRAAGVVCTPNAVPDPHKRPAIVLMSGQRRPAS